MTIQHPIDKALIDMIKARTPMRGLFNGLCSPAIVEMTAYAGYDFTIIDNEHGSANLETTENMLRAARASGLPALVRCLEQDIARTLDAGASGLQIPMVHNAAHAHRVVNMVRYPRATGFKGVSGERGCAYSVRAAGFGAWGGAAHDAKSNNEVALVVMIETMEAVNNAVAIAAVDGVDAVFIGPNDLAHSMGFESNFYAPEVQAAIEKAIRGIASTGKCAGVLALTPQEEALYASWGASYFASVVTSVISKALKDSAQAGRSGETGKLTY